MSHKPSKAASGRGGARPGAGRKPNLIDVPGTDDPLQFLLAVMNTPSAPVAQRVRAAAAALPFMHAKLAEPGKKQARAEAGRRASTSGKFRSADPPRLVHSRSGPAV